MNLRVEHKLKETDRCPACDAEDWRQVVKRHGTVRQCRTCRYLQRRCTTGHWTDLDDYDRDGYCIGCQRIRGKAGV
jgi:hypothetical protein